MQPRAYPIAGEFRRSAMYGLSGVGVISLIFLGLVIGGVGEADRVVVSVSLLGILLAAICIGCVYPLVWSLHVDERGIMRRRLSGSDVWSWDDFASGRIQKLPGFIFRDAERPWWRRILMLDFLEESDRKELIALINAHYRLPEPPTLPEMLRVRYGFRRHATFTHDGIELRTDGETVSFRWNSVSRLRITRHDPLRRDFARLVLIVAEREIELNGSRWSGATAEEVSEYLLAHVPSDCVDIDLFDGPAARTEDARKKLVLCHRLILG